MNNGIAYGYMIKLLEFIIFSNFNQVPFEMNIL